MSRLRLRALSLGAGVQSSMVLLLALEGRIPAFDAALFADTWWGSCRIYIHLVKLLEHAQ